MTKAKKTVERMPDGAARTAQAALWDGTERMSEMFPLTEYRAVMEEAIRIVRARDEAGRNAFLPFYEQFVHGSQDLVHEMHRRAVRIVGCEKQMKAGLLLPGHARKVMRDDAVDLINYAAFFVMVLDREASAEDGA